MTDDAPTTAEPRHHLLIAGQGRSGTTLLVKVLSACGFETHLEARGENASYSPAANAGLEDKLSRPDSPYVVKSPLAYQELGPLLERGLVAIDHAVVPVRRLRDAAASRVITEIQNRICAAREASAPPEREAWDHVAATAGGATFSLEPIDQERILATGFTRLVESLVRYDVPTTFLDFPRFAHDHRYLYEKLAPIIGERITWADFGERVGPVIQPELVRVGSELDTILSDGDVERPSLDELAELGTRRALDLIRRDRDALREEFDRSRREHAASIEQLRREMARLTREHEAAAQRWEKHQKTLREELRRLTAKLKRTEAEARSIRAKFQAQVAANRSITAKNEALQAEITSLTAEHTATAARLAAIQRSRSWRWTAPLRGRR